MTDYAVPSAPTTGDKIALKEHIGNLLLIGVTEVVKDVVSDYGTSDAIRANVAILDGDNKGKTYDDTLLFSKSLQSQLKNHIGSRVLGRLGQGENKKGNPPWILSAPTPDDITVAQKYDAYIASKSTVAPAEDPF